MATTIRYDGELIAAGELRQSHLMFWTAIRLAPEFDADAVEARLIAIRKVDAVQFERRGDVFAFPPRFSVTFDAPTGGENRG